MSILDKMIAAFTPPESQEDRVEAHSRAQQFVSQAPWLADVLHHHGQIYAAFDAVKSGTSSDQRRSELKQLAVLLTAHSVAEEAVIYPALSDNGDNGHATMAYTEQSAAKMQIGLLERMDPMSQDFDDKLGHLEGAVKHHIYQEEGTWFIDLVESAPDADHRRIAERYSEEFNRYMSGGDNFMLREGKSGTTDLADDFNASLATGPRMV
jgi:hemerythrin superfamily protein